MKQQVKAGSGNYYTVLEVAPGASHNEILHAYARAKQTYSGGALASYSILDDDTTEKILKEVENAFHVLGNPAKRRKYDMDMGYSPVADGDHHEINAIKVAPERTGPMIFTAPKLDADLDEHPKATVHVLNKAKHSTPGQSFEPNPEFERRIADCKELDGAFLRTVRIYRQWSVEALAQRCKLSPLHVRILEEEDTEHMLPAVYLRGHVRMIAHELQIPNPEDLSKNFVDRLLSAGKVAKSHF